MSLNDTPSAERTQIAFFGVRNAGKSSLVNAVTGQDLSVVSDVAGTTTDPVRKAMELLPLGPVVIIDTPGIDDEGALGSMRVDRTRRILRQCDIAVLVSDATRGHTAAERELLDLFAERSIPHVIVLNKCDLLGEAPQYLPENAVLTSALTGSGVYELKERLAHLAASHAPKKRLVADLLDEGDVAILVMPIDASAPKGRLILPQQMVVRDILDAHATCLVCQPQELAGSLAALAAPPRIVITDSQAFAQVAPVVPKDVLLTSFSILMARYKGSLEPFVRGAAALSHVTNESHVLISEGCTHHRQCEDIGTVKIPALLKRHAGSEPQLSFTSGGDFPDDLRGIDLVIHCGACMLNDREVASRVGAAQAAGVPIVNYGMAIAAMNGILPRTLQPFPEIAALLTESD